MFSLIGFIIIVSFYVTESSFTLIKTIENQADYYETDHQQNIYSVSGSKVVKFNSKGEKLFTYSNAYLGNISQIDVSDPFRILLFYQEFNQILFTDNFLVEIGSPIILDDLGHFQVSASCLSNHGGFWLFDDLEKKIYYYNKNLQLVHESISLNGFMDNTSPNCMIEKNKLLFLNIPDKGVIICDEFGGYIRTLPLNNVSSFQIVNEKIMYYCKDTFYISGLMPNMIDIFTVPDIESALDIRIENNQLYIFSTNYFNIYKID